LDFPPYVYIENDRYTSQSVSRKGAPHFGIKKGFRPGWIADDFDPRTTLGEFRDRSAEYIRKWDGKKPFALYVPLTSPHTPIVPTGEWQGKSGVGSYGDFVMQTDAVVGAILDAVDERGIAKDTIIVFTADNGCSPAADIEGLASKGHRVSHIYRGNKADIFEGGHRVPHIVRWPAKVGAGSTTDRLTVLGDIVATMADIVGAQLPANAAEDSLSFYPALLGKHDPKKEHVAIINHSVDGAFAVRTKEWKLAFCPGSGGWSAPRDNVAEKEGLPAYQLFDMVNDPGETTNLHEQKPEIVERLTRLGTDIVVNGRSTPGKAQANDTPNDWKQLHWMKVTGDGK
jgi:arylsulfatase A-like enzyme